MPVAVVTGSNKGIGLGVVRALCKKYQGDVYLTSRNEANGKERKKIFQCISIYVIVSIGCCRNLAEGRTGSKIPCGRHRG